MILGFETWQERLDEADFVFHIVLGSCESNEQDSDMSNGDIIWDGFEASDGWILHTDIEESGEDSLWSGTQF